MAAPGTPGWQRQVLAGVGAPITPENLRYVDLWARAEGGNATNNPFNTTQPGYHETGKYNSVGVRNYGDPQSGIQATIHTLQNGHYGNILAALKKGNSALADAQALAASPWGTGALVLKMLGSHTTPSPGGGVTSKDLARSAIAAPQQPNGAATGARTALLSMLQNQLASYASTGQNNSNPMQLQQALAAYQTAQAQQSAPSTLPRAPGKVLQGIKPSRATMPGLTTEKGITSIPGTSYQANAQILPQVESISKMFGVRVNSAYRSPQHNKEVGGAPHSDHLSGNAIDFVGTQAQMQKLYQWAQGKFPYVEPWNQAGGNHVHISFIR